MLLWFVVIGAIYVALVLVLALWQDALVFRVPSREDRGLPAAPELERGELTRSGGATFRIVTARLPRPRGVAVFFVGTAGDLHKAARGAVALRTHGIEAIGVEHPGYGTSPGPTTVDTVLAAARAAGAHARARADELGVPLVAVGSSLGTFAAVHVAVEVGCERLLLKAPPTTLLAAAKVRFWWLPVGLLLRHRFDNVGRAAAVRCPVLVLHGDRDTVVPLAMGRALAASFSPPARLVIAQGYGHRGIPLDRDGPFGAAIGAFLTGAAYAGDAADGSDDTSDGGAPGGAAAPEESTPEESTREEPAREEPTREDPTT